MFICKKAYRKNFLKYESEYKKEIEELQKLDMDEISSIKLFYCAGIHRNLWWDLRSRITSGTKYKHLGNNTPYPVRDAVDYSIRKVLRFIRHPQNFHITQLFYDYMDAYPEVTREGWHNYPDVWFRELRHYYDYLMKYKVKSEDELEVRHGLTILNYISDVATFKELVNAFSPRAKEIYTMRFLDTNFIRAELIAEKLGVSRRYVTNVITQYTRRMAIRISKMRKSSTPFKFTVNEKPIDKMEYLKSIAINY